MRLASCSMVGALKMLDSGRLPPKRLSLDEHARGQQRVAAQLEEVVINAYGFNFQQLGPNFSNSLSTKVFGEANEVGGPGRSGAEAVD